MAEEYRAMAFGTRDPDLRRRLLQIAGTCTELAERLETLERQPDGDGAAT